MYSVPYKLGVSLTILFVYLLICMFVLQIRKLNLARNSVVTDLHVRKLQNYSG